ncbi:hypothetical protein GCM10009624_14030 [Gordonia sinesedis]
MRNVTASTRFGWAAVTMAVGAAIWLHPAPAAAGPAETTATPAQQLSSPLTSPAERVVRLMTGPDHALALAAVPADFATVMGYRPADVDGYPVNPTGGCSSPVALPDRFEILCRDHDFGYDLLRYADRTGRPIGGWARLSLDRMLVERMERSCDDLACLAAAEVVRVGLALNTWREQDGPPGVGVSASDIATSTVRRAAGDVADRLTGRR